MLARRIRRGSDRFWAMGGGTSKGATDPAPSASPVTSNANGVDAALVTFCKSLKAADYETFKAECIKTVSLTAHMTVEHGLYIVLKVRGSKH